MTDILLAIYEKVDSIGTCECSIFDLPADFPKDLFFNSGAGGWRMYLRLNSIEKDIYLFYNK